MLALLDDKELELLWELEELLTLDEDEELFEELDDDSDEDDRLLLLLDSEELEFELLLKELLLDDSEELDMLLLLLEELRPLLLLELELEDEKLEDELLPPPQALSASVGRSGRPTPP